MRLFNTQTGVVEPFTAIDNKVGIYVCGVTPYDTTHIGHAFTFLTFDVLVRYLRRKGFDVTYVQNVTDIDDDILRKSKELGMDWLELGTRETNRLLADLRDLNAVDFDHYTKATEHIPQMVELIEALVEKEHAYESNGSVYFSVDSDPEFGKLSHIPRAEMLPIANERGNTPDDRTSVIHSISSSGKPPRPANRRGNRRGVPPLRLAHRVHGDEHSLSRQTPSIFMAAAAISFSRITNARSPRPKTRPASSRLSATGCTSPWSNTRARR
ncbi:MAG: class I tRNA ligase family protein [Thermomicrobiales bacterium]